MRQKTYALARAILERKDILFGSIENVVKPQAMKEKEDAWESVRNEMIEQGFVNFERKSWRDVRNHDWQYLRRSAVAKYEHNQKAGVEMIHYNEVDRLVFEIMGNEVSIYDNTNNDSVYFSSNMTNDSEVKQNEMSEFLSTLGTDTSRTPKTEELQQKQQHLTTAVESTTSGRQLSRNSAQLMGFLMENKNASESTELKSKSKDLFISSNLSPCNETQPDLLQSLISSSSLINYSEHNEATPSQPSISQPVISSIVARKRTHSCSSASAKSTEDELTEAKLRLLMMQIRREEVILKQETYKLAQEEAKLRQERAKAELLEMQLRTERAKSNGVTL